MTLRELDARRKALDERLAASVAWQCFWNAKCHTAADISLEMFNPLGAAPTVDTADLKKRLPERLTEDQKACRWKEWRQKNY